MNRCFNLSLLLGVALIWCQAAWSAPQSLKLLVPAAYVPGLPASVRVELRDEDGEIDRETWDAEAVLSADDANVILSTNRVKLWNGLGSVLVTFSGGGDFELTAQWEGLSDSKPMASLEGVPRTEVSGVLSGESTTWSGIVHVTNDVIVPAGHELTIASNTWVLVDAVVFGPPAPDILVYGTIRSQGTERHPVTITSADPVLHWGQIRHETAAPSSYRHTIVTRAGQAPREPHTSTGPAIRCTNSVVHFDYCTISDHYDATRRSPGKIMQTSRSEIIINDCLMARSRMGPEFDATIIHCTNTWFVEMNAGIDDEDGIYIHYQGPGRQASLVDCVVADVTDDGIDTIGSELIVRNCIIRDVTDKGMSITGGESRGNTLIENCLIVDCNLGVSTKGPTTNNIYLNHTTVRARSVGIFAERRAITAENLVRYAITNSIIEATAPAGVAIRTDYGIEHVLVHYSNIRHTNWPGAGIIDADPMYVDASNHNFHLLPGSPCIDTGDPDSPLDPDGTRTDMGAFPYFQNPEPGLRLLAPGFEPDGRFSFVIQGEPMQAYEILGSSNFVQWMHLTTETNGDTMWKWISPDPPEARFFYRVQTAP